MYMHREGKKADEKHAWCFRFRSPAAGRFSLVSGALKQFVSTELCSPATKSATSAHASNLRIFGLPQALRSGHSSVHAPPCTRCAHSISCRSAARVGKPAFLTLLVVRLQDVRRPRLGWSQTFAVEKARGGAVRELFRQALRQRAAAGQADRRGAELCDRCLKIAKHVHLCQKTSIFASRGAAPPPAGGKPPEHRVGKRPLLTSPSKT